MRLPRLPDVVALVFPFLFLNSAVGADSGLRVAPGPGAAGLEVTQTRNTDVVPLREVLEVTFVHEGAYANPFFDVTIDVRFRSPGGRSWTVGGFHYGSLQPPAIEKPKKRGGRSRPRYIREKQNVWKARFVPGEVGRWRYTYDFKNNQGARATGSGSFRCVAGRRPAPGFVRRHATQPHRWVFEDGTPYFPLGLQECVADNSATGSFLDTASLEGPFRTDRTDLVKLPPGPLYVRGPSCNPQNGDVYFRRYGRAGFNLFRVSQRNCSYDLLQDLDHYYVEEGVMTDELLRHVRKYGFRVLYGLFGFRKVLNDEPDNAAGMEKVKRFVKYSADRWGAYVDFWEFLNEQKAHDRWYAQLIPYLRSVDPYNHPITTSWERPDLDGIEINAPHWYGNENELESDAVTASRAQRWKKFGKPVIVGEQGNAVRRQSRPAGVGGVWDAGSARRMRLRLWTAFFHEIAIVFWNTSYARDGHHMNIWLGPTEREYVRALQDFAYRLDPDVGMVPVSVSVPAQARAYGLASAKRAGVYLHHYETHTDPLRGLKVSLDVPAAARGYWYSPRDAALLGTVDVAAGRVTLEAPAFVVDLALLITADGPPDIDRDGRANDVDPDDDNDGVADEKDAFPLEPEEWEDRDKDLIGDNLDADRDGDGSGDDHNGNGIPDHEELDLDGDGVPRARAVPWDAFPRDVTEWCDTDGDGVGDNADPDDDGDGWSDGEEEEAGTDPRDPLRFPVAEEDAR